MRRLGLTCALALLAASGGPSAASAWPGESGKRQAERYKAAYNAQAEIAQSGRGVRIAAMRCLPSTNGRYYCHTLFRGPRAVGAPAGGTCLELEMQPPVTILRMWPVVCDDGTGAVLAPMPKAGPPGPHVAEPAEGARPFLPKG